MKFHEYLYPVNEETLSYMDRFYSEKMTGNHVKYIMLRCIYTSNCEMRCFL